MGDFPVALWAEVHCSTAVSSVADGRRTMCMTTAVRAAGGRRTTTLRRKAVGKYNTKRSVAIKCDLKICVFGNKNVDLQSTDIFVSH